MANKKGRGVLFWCSHCNEMRATFVTDTRSGKTKLGVNAIRRRRECYTCGTRTSTYEMQAWAFDVATVKIKRLFPRRKQQMIDFLNRSEKEKGLLQFLRGVLDRNAILESECEWLRGQMAETKED